MHHRRRFRRAIWIAGALNIAAVASFAVAVWTQVKNASALALNETRDLVVKRVDAEFQTERIRATVTSVAQEQARGLIASEVRPAIEDARRVVAGDVQNLRKLVAEADRQVREAAGREVSREQAQALHQALVAHPKGKVDLVAADGESLRYADQLARVFRRAGWTVNAYSGIGMLGYSPHAGNILQLRGAASDKEYMEADTLGALRPRTAVTPAAVALAEALAKAGIQVKYVMMYGGSPGEMDLFIGYKQ